MMLLLLGAIVYFPSLDNWYAGFSDDDNWMVFENLHVFSLSMDNIVEYFTGFYRGQYSPINTLAYGLIYNFFGINPFYFHAFSLILHLTNTLLVGLMITHILAIKEKQRLVPEEKMYASFIAFVTALLFLIHPVQVESVVWVSASKVLLYVFFFLAALICYLKYIDTSKKRFYLLGVFLFVLAFGAKEQAVVFPLVLVLMDWFLGRNLKNRTVILEKLPFFLLSIGFSMVSFIAQQKGFSYKLENEYYPLMDRLFLACYAFIEYIFKLLVPFKLSAWYKFPIAPGEAVPPRYYFYPLLILFLCYFLWECWKERKYGVLFGMAFFIINIMLTLHILPMARGVLMADRYVYMGSIGIFYILSAYGVNLYRKNKSERRRWMMLSAFILYLISLGGYTFWYTDNWNII